jgi:hypothetical protein
LGKKGYKVYLKKKEELLLQLKSKDKDEAVRYKLLDLEMNIIAEAFPNIT